MAISTGTINAGERCAALQPSVDAPRASTDGRRFPVHVSDFCSDYPTCEQSFQCSDPFAGGLKW